MEKSPIDILLHQVTELLNGKYGKPNKIDVKTSNINALASGINKLRQELKESTHYRDYFETIFNHTNNAIFILKKTGIVEHLNQTAVSLIKKPLLDKENFNINDVLVFHQESTKNKFNSYLNKTSKNKIFEIECSLKGCTKLIPVKLTLNYAKKINQFVLIAQDITTEKELEKRLLKTIVETQLKEQHKIAKEIHDSVSQNLSGAKMLVKQLKISNKDASLSKTLDILTDAIEESVTEIRDISHDLMPSYLRFPIKESITQLVEKLRTYVEFKINLSISDNIPKLNTFYRSSIYRVIQEFTHNTIKHANATKLDIDISATKNKLIIKLQDDGKGFNKKENTQGIGVNNMVSRLKTFDGSYLFDSKIDKGTKLNFEILL